MFIAAFVIRVKTGDGSDVLRWWQLAAVVHAYEALHTAMDMRHRGPALQVHTPGPPGKVLPLQVATRA